jgi:hypothetical protein
MAQGRPAEKSNTRRAWFVYQLTDAEGNTLARTSGMFASDAPEFGPIEARVRALAKACGFDQYIMLDRCGHVFYASGKAGSKCPEDRTLLQQWAAEDRATVAALPQGIPTKGEL